MRPGSAERVMASVASLLEVPKYSHHIARVPRKVASTPETMAVFQASVSASMTPVASSVSPSATITNNWQRSARWPPSMVQSRVWERPMPGRAKPNMGEPYSHSTAASHSSARNSCPSAIAPAIQKTAAMTSHPSMRR